MKAHRAEFPVRAMCRVLGLSPSGYYAWLKRTPPERARRDAELREKIEEAWEQSRRTYGRPRIHAELKARGERVGSKRVGRLMKQAGIEGVTRRRRKVVTTRRDAQARAVPDLVDRDFSVGGPDRLWVADITYVPTDAGWLYAAVVVDAWSRLVVGWAMETSLRSELVEKALAMAVWRRRPKDVIHHSDQGSQYTSYAFGKRCREAGVRPSAGSVGDAYDNAMCESFFATLECELLDRSRFRSPDEARRAVFDFIEGFYNRVRRHSALGYESPADFEKKHAAWPGRVVGPGGLAIDPVRRRLQAGNRRGDARERGRVAARRSLRLPAGSMSRREDGGYVSNRIGGGCPDRSARDVGCPRPEKLSSAAGRRRETEQFNRSIHPSTKPGQVQCALGGCRGWEATPAYSAREPSVYPWCEARASKSSILAALFYPLLALQSVMLLIGWAAHAARRLTVPSGKSSQVFPSSSRPPAFGVLPPHCLKKNGTLSARH